MGILSDATTFATAAHDGQVDKAGVPYIQHPLRVMDQTLAWGLPVPIRAAAVLHDVVEDTNVEIEEIVAKFGNEVADPLRALTHPRGEPYLGYIDRVIEAGPYVMAIKMADMLDNTLPRRRKALDGATDERLGRKYRPAWARLRNAMSKEGRNDDVRVALSASRVLLCSPVDLYWDGRR